MVDLQELKSFVDGLRPEHGDHAYQVAALGLIARSPDYDLLWSESCLDGSDDKKTDILYIDYASGRVVFAQGTESVTWADKEPPSNKASDLNTAIAWLFDSDLEDIGRDDIRTAARDLRAALDDGKITSVEVYFIHNFPESENARVEMRTVARSLASRLERWEEGRGESIGRVAAQFGRESALAAYTELHSSIRVTETVAIRAEEAFQVVEAPEWTAAVGPVSAATLVDLRTRFGDDLFAPNIRDFLGIRRGRANINDQIRTTVAESPANFWIFNNGVTFVVRQLRLLDDQQVECVGLGVTNGAQTIGSLYQAHGEGMDLSQVRVQARSVRSEPYLIDSIIRFNNTQNPIKAWELRVLDPTQKRVAREFADELNLTYVNRRSTARVSADQVHISRLAPWVSSFHGNPQTAHRNSPELFEDDAKYNNLFGVHTDVHHLLLTYRVGEAVISVKDEYKELVRAKRATPEQEVIYGYFRFGAFTYSLINLIADVIVELRRLGEPSRARLRMTPDLEGDREAAITYLSALVRWVLRPLPKALDGKDAFAVFRSEPELAALSRHLQELAGAVQEASPDAINPMVGKLNVAD